MVLPKKGMRSATEPQGYNSYEKEEKSVKETEEQPGRRGRSAGFERKLEVVCCWEAGKEGSGKFPLDLLTNGLITLTRVIPGEG